MMQYGPRLSAVIYVDLTLACTELFLAFHLDSNTYVTYGSEYNVRDSESDVLTLGLWRSVLSRAAEVSIVCVVRHAFHKDTSCM